MAWMPTFPVPISLVLASHYPSSFVPASPVPVHSQISAWPVLSIRWESCTQPVLSTQCSDAACDLHTVSTQYAAEGASFWNS